MMDDRVSIFIDGEEKERQARRKSVGRGAAKQHPDSQPLLPPQTDADRGVPVVHRRNQRQGGLFAACTLTVAEGMAVTAFDEELEAARRDILDYRLSEHNESFWTAATRMNSRHWSFDTASMTRRAGDSPPSGKTSACRSMTVLRCWSTMPPSVSSASDASRPAAKFRASMCCPWPPGHTIVYRRRSGCVGRLGM